MTDSNVVPLFKVPPDHVPEGAEVPAGATESPQVAPLWVRSGRAVRAAATHDRTRTAGRTVVRHGSYVVGGGRIVVRRAWDGRTAARYERMIRAAEAAGDREGAAEWEERGRAFRAARHQRRMDLLTAPERVVKNAAYGTGGTLGGLLLLGVALAVATKNPGDVVVPLMALVELCRLLVVIATVVWGPLVAFGPWLALVGLWAVGRQRRAAPAWALAADGQAPESVPDESAIIKALQHMSLPALNKAFKEGWQPRWVQPTTRSGAGWHTQLQLPLGVTVEMVNGRKNVLAHNLLRKPVEVWPTEPRQQPGVLDLWVADQGSLSGPVPPWPLLTEGTSDYFHGVPVTVSQRGDQITGKLMAANWMIGGIMGSGKSSLVVSLLLGAILDPLVDIEAYVMAYNVDYDPLKPRLDVLVKGDEDEQIEAARDALRRLRDEVSARGKLLEELGGDTPRLTRELAQRDPRMRPKVVVFDECHELFMHKQYGPEAAELAVKVMKKARKVGITLVWVTVSPTADSIPRDVTRNTSHRVAFAVGDHVANDGLLGSGKHKAGITATTLVPGEDVGTAVTVGFTKNAFEVVRAYYVQRDPEKGLDEVTPVVDRAMGLRDGLPATPRPDGPTPVDHLADIARVLTADPDGPARMRSDDVRQRLTSLNPGEYRHWTAADLKRVLEPYDAEPHKSRGLMVVSRDRVVEALHERDTATPESDAG